MSGQASNKPLFSQHYLEHRLPDSGEWQEDVSVAFSRLKSLYQQKKAILPTLNEAQTEAELIVSKSIVKYRQTEFHFRNSLHFYFERLILLG
jgi:hypothetical protein